MDPWAITAAVFMVIAVTLSFYTIIRHLCNFTRPYLQRYIIRILLMVPIYSINAWIAMILPVTGLYLDSLREVYESFVIYSFMKYLLNFLHYDTNLQQYINHKPGPRHIFPFCFLPTCIGGKTFMVRCKHGILQYVIIRPLTTLIAFTSQLFGFYGEGNFNPLSGYTFPVLLIINNISQLTAMYCLVIFYTGYRQELNPMQPLAKFFSIKLVVFFSFFQSVVIYGLLEIEGVEMILSNILPGLDDKVALGRKLQEFLICFDMLVASLGHSFAFSHKPFVEDDDMMASLDNRSVSRSSSFAKESHSCCAALSNILDFSDEKSDVSEHFSQILSRIRHIFTFNSSLPDIVSGPSSTNLDNNWIRQEEIVEEADTPRNLQIPINRSGRSYKEDYQSMTR